MKYLKCCLISLIIIVGICIIGWLSFENNITGNLADLNRKAEEDWEKYVANLKLRNSEFTQQKIKNDSIEYYLKTSKSIINSKDYITELELNEYKLNKFLLIDSINSNLNDKLNSILDNYNESVRDYHVYRVQFPNSIIAKRMNFRKSHKYFDIRYGIDNEKAMQRKKENEKLDQKWWRISRITTTDNSRFALLRNLCKPDIYLSQEILS